MLTTSSEWGEMVTKLTVPKEWKGMLVSHLSLCESLVVVHVPSLYSL